jgi:hypothetical protein
MIIQRNGVLTVLLLIVLAALTAADCRSEKPLVIDDTTGTRRAPAPEPPRCSLVPNPHEDPSQLAVRCGEEFVAARGARVWHLAEAESIGGAAPPSRVSHMASFLLDPRAVAVCRSGDGYGVVFRTSPHTASGTMVEVPASRAGIRISRDLMPLVEGPRGDLELPVNCSRLPDPARDAR